MPRHIDLDHLRGDVSMGRSGNRAAFFVLAALALSRLAEPEISGW
jgi:hypothetical protein